MKINYCDLVLKDEEKAVFALRALYYKYGYKQYKVSKFEEYDLYAENKNFLANDHILTFTDTDGHLMALKPDVTLSIVKNMCDCDITQKFCYNENVYRVTEHSYGFKEIMQTGLECIGEVDIYCICEVIFLAAKSLEIISKGYILDVSHLGIISKLVDKYVPNENIKRQIYKCISAKNTYNLKIICHENQISNIFYKELSSLLIKYIFTVTSSC